MPKKIYFDGLNLGLKHGTGVATYARVLAGLARDMGYQTGVLHSVPRSLPRKLLEREVDFFDRRPPLPLPAAVRAMLSLGGYVAASAGIRPQKVPRTGAVITKPFDADGIDSDEIFAYPNVFDRARGLFVASGRFANLRFPEKADLFHWTYPLPMTSNARANIYTVHDLVPVRLPYTTLDWKRYYIKAMRAILAKADHIVTVSENSKRDIVAYFGVDEKRITNTYQAVNIPRDRIERPKSDIAEELGGVFGLEMGKYLLFYGSLEPKKNVSRIVQAYLAANIAIPLVVVVAQTWQSDGETRLLEQIVNEDKAYGRAGERRRICRYDYMPRPLLLSLIQGARAVLFPSLYEGFGLPVLEAMTLGTPVITSNNSSVPEIAGDAALAVDPYDTDAIRKAIIAVDRDADLCAQLSRDGLARAGDFSLDAYRKRVSDVYAKFL